MGKKAIGVLCIGLMAVLAGSIAAAKDVGEGQTYLHRGVTADGISVEWGETVNVDASVRQWIQWVDLNGGTHSVELAGWFEGEELIHEFRLDDFRLDVSDMSGLSTSDRSAFHAEVHRVELRQVLASALSDVPPNESLNRSFFRLATSAPSPDRFWCRRGHLDCYGDCVDDERSRCQRDCDTKNALNPCLSICYIGISIGCDIGCC